ncbi:MAG: DUF928 domain-containing protein [Verrucomicrobiia bacterium]
MKCNAANRWFWMTALGVMVPCLLYSGEVTNQTPPAVSTEKTKEVEPTKQEPPPPPVTPVRTKIVYKPPLRGAPAVRIDGGSRGSGVSLVCLTVLAPDHTGLTVQEQPSLFWYQSQPADVPFELTLLADNTIQPLLLVRLPDSRAAGIQRLNLAEHNVKLLPGVEYEWVVALVVDPENRSKDVIASGWIKRVEPSPSLRSRLENAAAENLPSVYAEEGVWLDTLTALSALIEARPKDKALQEGRAALLEQVGLTNAAMYAASQTASD